MPNPDVDAEPGIEEITEQPDESFEEFIKPPEGHNPFQESMQEAAAEDVRPKGNQEEKTGEEAPVETAGEEETQEEFAAPTETKTEKTEKKAAPAETKETKAAAEAAKAEEDGISEEDIEKFIETQTGSGGELPESLRSLGEQSPYQEQRQQQEQTETEELPPIDLGKAKTALVAKLGEEEGNQVAEALEPYMGEVLSQASGYIDAAIKQGIRNHAAQMSRETAYLKNAAAGFYEAYPDLQTPSGQRLVAMNYNRVLRNGRKYANDGEMLNHVGQLCLDQLKEIGGGESTKRSKPKRKGTQAETVGSAGARTVKNPREKEVDERSTSDKELDGILDFHKGRFDRGGVNVLQ